MIKYSLTCDREHAFDAWFASSDAYDKQRKRGLVRCPDCDSKKISKALMAPRVGVRQNKKADMPAPARRPDDATTAPQRLTSDLSDKQAALLALMREVRKEVAKTSDYVGSKFAEEARKIHNDEAPARGIYGEATLAEAKALAEDGIEAYPLPLLPEDQN